MTEPEQCKKKPQFWRPTKGEGFKPIWNSRKTDLEHTLNAQKSRRGKGEQKIEVV